MAKNGIGRPNTERSTANHFSPPVHLEFSVLKLFSGLQIDINLAKILLQYRLPLPFPYYQGFLDPALPLLPLACAASRREEPDIPAGFEVIAFFEKPKEGSPYKKAFYLVPTLLHYSRTERHRSIAALEEQGFHLIGDYNDEECENGQGIETTTLEDVLRRHAQLSVHYADPRVGVRDAFRPRLLYQGNKGYGVMKFCTALEYLAPYLPIDRQQLRDDYSTKLAVKALKRIFGFLPFCLGERKLYWSGMQANLMQARLVQKRMLKPERVDMTLDYEKGKPRSIRVLALRDETDYLHAS